MITEMKLVPHSDFGMPGSIQKHTLVYTIVAAMVLTVFFDFSRIASLGTIFYIVMDIAVQWGALRYIRDEIGANAVIVLDLAVLVALLVIKASTDLLVVYAALGGLAPIVVGERLFLRSRYGQSP